MLSQQSFQAQNQQQQAQNGGGGGGVVLEQGRSFVCVYVYIYICTYISVFHHSCTVCICARQHQATTHSPASLAPLIGGAQALALFGLGEALGAGSSTSSNSLE